MSTIAGKGSENENNGVRRYNGCGWDGEDYDYDYDDCGYVGDGVGYRGHGFYRDGIWYPPGTVLKQPDPVIEYTKEELRKLKNRYQNENTIIHHLSTKSEKSAEFFKFVDYINQEFKKIQKRYETAKEENERLVRAANYFLYKNKETYFFCEYEGYLDYHSVYITKRVHLRPGDILNGFNSTTKAFFNFEGGIVLGDGVLDGQFEKISQGILCRVEGIYDIEMIMVYGQDKIRIRQTTKELNKYEEVQEEFKAANSELFKFKKNTIKLHARLSNILDRGSRIDPENLDELLKRWQCLDRIVFFEVYGPYEKKVTRYGTSY